MMSAEMLMKGLSGFEIGEEASLSERIQKMAPSKRSLS